MGKVESFNPTTEQTRARVDGWAWVVSECQRIREQARAERSRLLGPDRGE